MKWISTAVVFFVLAVSNVGYSAVAPTGRYKAALDRLSALQKKYSKISKLITVGTNDGDVEIVAMRISLNPEEMDPKKIGQLVVSTHHGNELAAPEFTLAFTQKLLERYNSPDLFSGNLADMEWTIVPVLNISGYNANVREEKGLDPNRDYPGPCITKDKAKLKSIQTAIDLLKSRLYAGTLTVHGYLGAITYPWGVDVTDTHTNDHNQFATVAGKAAKVAGYQTGTSTDIVYPVDGAFEDYSYWKHGAWSLLLELKRGETATQQAATVEGISTYFDLIDSSPSVKNQLTGKCVRSGRMDLHNE